MPASRIMIALITALAAWIGEVVRGRASSVARPSLERSLRLCRVLLRVTPTPPIAFVPAGKRRRLLARVRRSDGSRA